MMPQAQSRPWYCSDNAVEEYKVTLTEDAEKLRMLKLIKVFRALVVNGGLLTFGAYAMFLGGDPTLIGVVTLLTFVGYNGLEYSDYRALIRAVRELQGLASSDGSSDTNDDSDQ